MAEGSACVDGFVCEVGLSGSGVHDGGDGGGGVGDVWTEGGRPGTKVSPEGLDLSGQSPPLAGDRALHSFVLPHSRWPSRWGTVSTWRIWPVARTSPDLAGSRLRPATCPPRPMAGRKTLSPRQHRMRVHHPHPGHCQCHRCLPV